MPDLTPRETVAQLDRYIIGQAEAKRAVAIALRNRVRRRQLPEELQEEIVPKNIILMGPTGVGKTEIARRLAKLAGAPFIKVEATKFTEVGYVGRDVESMVRDLLEAAIRMVKAERMDLVADMAARNAEQRLVEALVPARKHKPPQNGGLNNIFQQMLNPAPSEPELSHEERERVSSKRDSVLFDLREGRLEEVYVEIEVEPQGPQIDFIPGAGVEANIQDMMEGIMPKKVKTRRLPVREARKILHQQEAAKLIDMDDVTSAAVTLAEQDGIIFLDEIDKIAERGGKGGGPDVSREGVQRDILPIVEGSTVTTKYGPVKTDHMLFVAAGAFHVAKVTDLIPELQGRFPIQVALKALTEEDYRSILTQPENALIRQVTALLAVDHVNLTFTEEALAAIAHVAYLANEGSENIGARRLHAVVEQLVEDLSFNAGGDHPDMDVVIDADYVTRTLGETLKEQDVRRYIL